MADVSTPIAEYNAASPLWRQIADACAGEAAVKAAGDTYLPRPNPSDQSAENAKRFEQYVKRAVYFNASGNTLRGLVGLAFAKFPETEIPAGISDVAEDVDGAGQTLVQHMHKTLGEVVAKGRAGLLADFPVTDGNTSVAQERTAGIRPTLTFYTALSIINWDTAKVGGKLKLSLVVLRECHRERADFVHVEKEQYRVLQLTGGVYTVEIWRESKNDAGVKQFVKVETIEPKGGNGKPLDFIPFTFVGSENNGTDINVAPMLDLCSLNLAHYRNSADYEDSAYFCGQPQFWMAGLDQEWVKMLKEQGIYIGSRAILPLPVNGSAGIMQAEPNTLAREAMDQKEKQLASLGARLIQSDKSVKTATQQTSEDVAAHSVLSLCCDNVSAAYTLAMQWVSMFANVTGKVLVSIPTEFTKFTIDGTELASLMDGVMRGLIPKSDFWARLRQAGVIASDKDDGAIQEEIDASPPPGLEGDDPEGDTPGNATA